MTKKNPLSTQQLVIVASTFPRWKNDNVTQFVQEHAMYMGEYFKSVCAVVPHYKGAASSERLTESITVKRFRYFKDSGENIVYEGHAVKSIKKNPTYLLKLFLYVLSGTLQTVRAATRNKTIINPHWLIPQGAMGVVAGKLTRNKVVVTIHGGDMFMLRGKFMTAIKKWVLKNADLVVANSSATKQACEEIYPDGTYKVIPMGIGLSLFNEKTFFAISKNIQALYLGRLSREKGVGYLLKAAKDNKHIKVMIAGEGPERKNLEQYVNENDMDERVTFAGWVPRTEVGTYFRNADVFVGPSIEDDSGWKEAFGLSFAEASLAGLPVIATKTGGISDIVKDGKTGYLVDQRNTEQIAEKLEVLRRDKALRQRMGKAGREHVLDKFSWNTISKKYAAEFENVITN